MAVLYSNKGDFDHCLSKYLKAVDIYDRLDREEPGIYDDDIARLKNNLGTLYSDRDEYNKALSEFNEAARIRFELLAKDNDPDSRSALADIYCNMATALQFSDHPQEALLYIAQAHAILDELDKEFPRIYEYKLYSILNREGSIYTRLDQLDKAEESFVYARQPFPRFEGFCLLACICKQYGIVEQVFCQCFFGRSSRNKVYRRRHEFCRF